MNQGMQEAMEASIRRKDPDPRDSESMEGIIESASSAGAGDSETTMQESPLPTKEERNSNQDGDEARMKADSLRPLMQSTPQTQP